MDRLKCPNCENSMHIEIYWEEEGICSDTHVKEYVCNCGCRFEAIYELVRTNILEIRG